MKRADQKTFMYFKTFAKFFHAFHKHNLYFFLSCHCFIKGLSVFSAFHKIFFCLETARQFLSKGFVSQTIKYENQSSLLSDVNGVVLMFFWLLT